MCSPATCRPRPSPEWCNAGGQLVALALLAAVTVAISIVGDLIESLMKRHARIKDSGSIFPGHGGLLDRLDSVFAALPVFVAGLWLTDLL